MESSSGSTESLSLRGHEDHPLQGVHHPHSIVQAIYKYLTLGFQPPHILNRLYGTTVVFADLRLQSQGQPFIFLTCPNFQARVTNGTGCSEHLSSHGQGDALERSRPRAMRTPTGAGYSWVQLGGWKSVRSSVYIGWVRKVFWLKYCY